MTKSTILITLLIAAPVVAGDFHIRFEDQTQAKRLSTALIRAEKALEQPACSEIFNDYDLDPNDLGKPILFAEDPRTCPLGIMVTELNGNVIYVCNEKVKGLSNKHLTIIVIHELLHTIGLAEDGSKINRKIQWRCKF